jgi:hypothetical protein
MKKEHKFFTKKLTNDLDFLSNFLIDLNSQMINMTFPGISKAALFAASQKKNVSTPLASYYNLFKYDNKELINLKNSLKELTVEACEYYDIDFEKENFYVRAWFNLDNKLPKLLISPLINSNNFHDHASASGAPEFHGYYSVNAEPSSTYYMINNENIFEVVNKNNVILFSETGHPHGRGDWFENKPRITIAYDISPLQKIKNFSEKNKENWIPLNEKRT